MSVELLNQILPNLKAGNREKVISLMKELIESDAELGDKWGSVARVATSIGEVALASEAAKRYVMVQPDDFKRKLSQAGILSELGQLKEALALIEPVVKQHPNEFSIHHFIGLVQSQLGDVENAIGSLKVALAIKPNSGHTWLTLSSLIDFEKNDQNLKKMEAVSRANNFDDPLTESAFNYAQGKALIDSGQANKAIRYIEKGSKLMSKLKTYNADKEREYIDKIQESFSSEQYKDLKNSDSAYSPIIVLGLPRSGTTLVTQLISSHTEIGGGGEFDLFREGMLPCKGYGLSNILERKEELGNIDEVWSEIDETYRRLISERFKTEGRVVDKSLNNSRFLGIIKKVYPKVSIIWVTRDPKEIAWSCYRNFFSQSLDWSWSLENIAEYFKMEDKLQKYWMEAFGDDILEVPYEQLVNNPESWAKKILSHCGLDFEADVLKFYESDNPVQTASVAQVRRPISSDSVGKAKKYEEFLQPFSDKYFS